MNILIENLLEQSECANVMQITKQISFYKSIEKLKQWININLNEETFLNDLKLRRFKKRPEQQTSKANEMLDEFSGCDKLVFTMNQTTPSEIFNEFKVFSLLLASYLYYFLNKLFSFQKRVMKSLVLKQTSQCQIEEEILSVFLKAIHFIQINVFTFLTQTLCFN